MAISPPHNLPAPLTSLVGREHEVSAARHLLRDRVRLLTLVGPAGIGKTRLALAVAQSLLDAFEHGAWFVPLAAVRDPALVVPAIARAVGVQEAGGRPLAEALAVSLRERRLLLVLDNLEHLPTAAPLIADLLATCPGVKVLATGRASLWVSGEQRYPVPPLAVPDLAHLPPAAELARVPAVALFVERARATAPGFALTHENAAAVAEICVRLDGLPLAIELAVARAGVLSPDAILARLGSRLTLLTGGARDWPVRHRSLRAAVDWSYELLPAGQQALFRRLAVFAGGFTLEAAEAVCGDKGAGCRVQGAGDDPLPTAPCTLHPSDVLDELASLVDQSLVVRGVGIGREPRFSLLETMREYALERLAAAGELEAARRHAEFYATLAERCEAAWQGPGQLELLARLEAEHGNLRAAADWCREAADGVAIGLRLAASLWWFAFVHGHLTEWRGRLRDLLGHPAAHRHPAHRGRALTAAGFLALRQGDVDAARALLDEAVALARGLADRAALAHALRFRAMAARNRGDTDAAEVLLDESLALWRALGRGDEAAWIVQLKAFLAGDRGAYAAAIELFEESLAARGGDGSRFHVEVSLRQLGRLWWQAGDPARAITALRECIGVNRQLGNGWGIAGCVNTLAWVAASAGDERRAARLLGAAAVLYRTSGSAPQYTDQVEQERCVARVRGALGEAAYAAEWGVGNAMAPDQAVAFALGRPAAAPPAPAHDRPAALTAREREVAALIGRGLTSRRIAERLVISERTADTHAEHIRAKLGLRSRLQVAAWAQAQGLLEPGGD